MERFLIRLATDKEFQGKVLMPAVYIVSAYSLSTTAWMLFEVFTR